MYAQNIAEKYPDGMPQLDPVNDMGIQDAAVLGAIQQMNQLEQQLANNPGEPPTLCLNAALFQGFFAALLRVCPVTPFCLNAASLQRSCGSAL